MVTGSEAQARETIDSLLAAAGWIIQDFKDLNLGAGLGVAVREFPVGEGFADYLLFVDRMAVGVVEAKKAGHTLSGVAAQSGAYLASVPDSVPHVPGSLPFAYESTGIETFFRDTRDPEPRSRRTFSFHQPQTLRDWAGQDTTLRQRLQQIPALCPDGMRACQVEAITRLEESLAMDRPRALIQMATGAGKTFTAVSHVYRLIKHAGARRVLFLVDRGNLGRQAEGEFKNYVTPDDGRKFSELYNVQRLVANTIDPVSRVCISTIQRLYAMLRGEDLKEEVDEHSGFEVGAAMGKDKGPLPVVYNPFVPIEAFDFVVVDECHRSIYNLWRQVLEYFDAHLIGLTATPSKQTIGFFNRNLVTEYSHERAVADGVNVGYEVYRIRTKITEKGSTVEAGHYVDRRSKLDRSTRWEQLDEDLTYTGQELNREVVSPDQIRLIVDTFRDRLPTEIFPGRTEVPKTLVFARDDSHAEDIVHIMREEFGKGNDFCQKITYKTYDAETKRYGKPETILQSFRNSYHPRIAVTVDMISTGTDVKPLECLLFLRDVRSRVYFDQMKGRGTRTIDPTDLNAVTPDATAKTHFVIVDAVGVCESDKGDSRPLERKRTVTLEQLMLGVALGNRDEDALTSLAGRLARIDRKIAKAQREEIAAVAGGLGLGQLANRLLDAVDPDKIREQAQTQFQTGDPLPDQSVAAAKELVKTACQPFDSPDLRQTILRIQQSLEQTIDGVSTDELIEAGFSANAKAASQTLVASFQQFIQDNRDELTALQILLNVPYGQRHLTYQHVKELAEAIQQPPYQLSAKRLWQAYGQLEANRVRQLGPRQLLTDLVSLVRFAMGEAEVLEPFVQTENERFAQWLAAQQASGKAFTDQQTEWLRLVRDHIAASLDIGPEDFDYAPFHERGGKLKAIQLFGKDLNMILKELTEVLAA